VGGWVVRILPLRAKMPTLLLKAQLKDLSLPFLIFVRDWVFVMALRMLVCSDRAWWKEEKGPFTALHSHSEGSSIGTVRGLLDISNPNSER
jgi:hypothetical protein